MAERQRDDQETYRQGRVAAAVGLGVQALLAVGAAALAGWSRSDAVAAAAWHMACGLPIWIVLVVLYGQFEIERRETLAAEKLATGDAATAALFGELSDELQRARQRVTNLVGYGLPAVSLLVAGLLVALGSLLAWRFLAQLADGEMATPAPGGHPVGLLFACGGLSFVAFGAGRWISGCARNPAWQLLRGGAGYLMSCFVVSVLLTIAAALAAVTDDTRLFHSLTAVIAAVMLLAGGEILVASLLEIYRPRRPGELPRPAFDSRLLGLLTSPGSLGDVMGDLIRYQFGVEISGSWLERLVSRALTPLVVLAATVLLALSCLVVVGPDEEGVVLRWGGFRGPPRAAGIHFKLPWPVETAETYPARRVLQLSVSSGMATRRGEDDPILWDTGDDRLAGLGTEYFPVVLASTAGGGLAVVDAEIVVQYRVHDLPAFLQAAPAPGQTIAVVAQQEAGRYFASHDLEFLLSRGRTEAGPTLTAAIQARLDSLRLGLQVVDVAITALQPPGGPVARAFHRQIAAGQERDTVVERARRDAVGILSRVAGSVELGRRIDQAILALDASRAEPSAATEAAAARMVAARQAEIDGLLGEARGEAAELIHAARGDRWTRSVGEQAARERFAGELLAYQRAPRYYRAARFLTVLAEGLADRRKFVVAGDPGDLPVLRMDFADPGSAIETLLGE